MVFSITMSIFPWRKRVIFRVESSLPDPLEQKYRLRQKIVALTFLGAVGVLSIPVVRDRQAAIDATRASRHLAEFILDSQSLGMLNRTSVLLELRDQHWQRLLLDSPDCKLAQSTVPPQSFAQNDIKWTIKYGAQELTQICLSPGHGLLDTQGQPLNHAQLQIVSTPKEDIEQARSDRSRYIQFGVAGNPLYIKEIKHL
jgi:hypothetical protein